MGAPLRLRKPGAIHCLHFDGALQVRASTRCLWAWPLVAVSVGLIVHDALPQALQDRECNETEARQHWSFDTATLMFRHTGDSSRCIEFFPSHGAFGAWSCRDDLEANTQQQFRFDEDRFCLLADPTRCLQEATSHLLY